MVDSASWRPGADVATLRRRAALLQAIRDFFQRRGLLEVETPLLSAAAVTDPALHSLSAVDATAGERWYLQTSPEFAMKRLLAAGSGSIWQVARVVRGGERGRRHNPEFSMLEWYRTGWDHHRLMGEVAQLIASVAGDRRPRIRTYAEVLSPLGVDAHGDDPERLAAAAAGHGLDVPDGLDRDGLLDLLLSHLITPGLGRDGVVDFVHAFPVSQAALARLDPGPPPTAERFECYLEGMELANGFHELADAGEQRRRFEADLAVRRRHGLAEPPLDECLLAALEHGLPDCAGVALGLDRLFMVALGRASIAEVMAFPS